VRKGKFRKRENKNWIEKKKNIKKEEKKEGRSDEKNLILK
jgi:hypothetical protein